MKIERYTLLTATGIAALVLGVGALGVGAFGISYTYQKAAEENITTPDDASIPNTPVRGPLTMLSQAEIIREHTYRSTGGMAYAQMPRTIQATDDNARPLFNDEGEPLMIPNGTREIWVTSTALQTALQLGVLGYALSVFAMLYGLTSIATGMVFLRLREQPPKKPDSKPA